MTFVKAREHASAAPGLPAPSRPLPLSHWLLWTLARGGSEESLVPIGPRSRLFPRGVETLHVVQRVEGGGGRGKGPLGNLSFYFEERKPLKGQRRRFKSSVSRRGQNTVRGPYAAGQAFNLV